MTRTSTARRPGMTPPRSPCRRATPDPVRALAPVLARMPGQTASRSATSSMTPATPTATPAPGRCRSRRRRATRPGPAPARPRPPGTHDGAIIANGNLYCPAIPRTLLDLGPLAPAATPEDTAVHDTRNTEPPAINSAASPPTTPTATTASRAPPPCARSAARSAPTHDPERSRPEILTPRSTRQPACTQQTLPSTPSCPGENPATRLPLRRAPPLLRAAHRRRTRLRRHQRPCHQHISRGWCRLMGLTHSCLAGLPARHPQPAHPHRLEHPPGRKRPPRLRRSATEEPGAAAGKPPWPASPNRHNPTTPHRATNRRPPNDGGGVPPPPIHGKQHQPTVN